MMKRLFFLTVLLVLTFGVTTFMGCSDDEKSTNPALQEGDTLDPTFVAFKEGFDGVDEFTGMMLSVMFNMADTVMNDPSNPNNKPAVVPASLDVQADSLLITYHALSQYWYFYMLQTSGLDTLEIVDSIQFLHGATPVQWPDSALLSGMKSGLSLYWQMSGAVVTASQAVDLAGDFPNLGVITANGSQQLNISFIDDNVEVNSDSMFCHFDFTFATEFNDVVFVLSQFDSGCPSTGTIVSTGSAGINCMSETDSVRYSGSWSVTQTFNGDTITWVFENETTRWTQTEPCGPSILKPSIVGFRPSMLTDPR